MTASIQQRGSASSARRELGACCAALAIGAVAVLGAISRTWAQITVQRAAPLPPVHLDMTGRSLNPVLGGLALVLLAGAVAVLATAGRARQVLGGALAALSALLIWVASTDAAGLSEAHARRAVDERFSGIGLAGPYPVRVQDHLVWSWVCFAAGLLCLCASLVVAVRGGRWRTMAARYDRPASAGPVSGDSASGESAAGAPDAAALAGPAPGGARSDEDAAAAQDLALWNALDRGDDPTRR